MGSNSAQSILFVHEQGLSGFRTLFVGIHIYSGEKNRHDSCFKINRRRIA